MTAWKNNLVVLTIVTLSISFAVFFATGYIALYFAWVRSNLPAALPFLPWARNSGMFAMAGAGVALVILFSSKVFPLRIKTRLWLSLLTAVTIGFFSEFRNEGKFHFHGLVHFFGTGTWIHDGLNRLLPSLGSFLLRVEYSHWNDFLMGPAIVSILFTLVFAKIYGTIRNQGTVRLNGSTVDDATDVEHAFRFARILMNVGLFWFFIQAWAEKAGYLRNPHSNDEIDLPFEFAGTMLGFWMARVLTRPLNQKTERFRSTFLIDFVSSGIIGLLYTLVVGPLTEGVASAVAHGLYPTVPSALEVHEYTSLQQHVRPFELLLLAGALWWGLNQFSASGELTRIDTASGLPNELESEVEATTQEVAFKPVIISMAKAVSVTAGYLLVLVTMLSFLEPEGVGWTIAAISAALGATTLALILIHRATQHAFMTVFGKKV